jgi:hypothetical protein
VISWFDIFPVIFTSKIKGCFGNSVAQVVDSVIGAGFPAHESALAAAVLG